MKDVVVIFCMTVKNYPEQPQDQSLCTIEDCPWCKQPMWLSEKKKGALKLAHGMGKNVWIGCSDCLEEAVTKNKLPVPETIVRL